MPPAGPSFDFRVVGEHDGCRSRISTENIVETQSRVGKVTIEVVVDRR